MPKQKRKPLMEDQKTVLEKVFMKNQFPDFELRKSLGEKLGLSPRQVQIWFQNKRAKRKKAFVESVSQAITLRQREKVYQTILFAAIKNDLAIIKEAVRIKHNMGITSEYFRQTPLHLACLAGNYQMVKLLLSHPYLIDINASDSRGFRPIHHAAIHGFVEIVKMLIQAGANVNIQSHEGYTPLHCAAINKKHRVVSLLFERGSRWNICDTRGRIAEDFLHLSDKRTKDIFKSHHQSLELRTNDPYSI